MGDKVMTKEELKEELKQIETEKKLKETLVFEKYALSNAIYKIGDIIEDHIGRIKIEKILWGRSFFDNTSIAIYEGTQLKKDLTPFKSGEKIRVYQNNVKDCAGLKGVNNERHHN